MRSECFLIQLKLRPSRGNRSRRCRNADLHHPGTFYSPRLEAVKKNFQVKGGRVKSFYLLLGQYDAVVVYEAPNDETVAELMLAIGAAGNVHTETHRAFTEEEYRKVIAAATLG